VSTPVVVVLMGVSGCGKSTVGRLLAESIGAEFAEGDRWHPPANIAKMSSGVALEDADRWPWLEALARQIDEWIAAGRKTVLSCSALRQAYRDILIDGRQGVRLVYLRGDEALIAERLARRRGHYMPASLLASQFAQLEEPAHVPTVDISPPPEIIAERIRSLLGL
jgi:carbohydrate kinase (thermoresistant glucokinase family)